jgi:hypothetical protein
MNDQGEGENVPQKPVTVFSQGVCEACGSPLKGRGRGPGKRYCNTTCRNAFLRQAREAGQQILRRRRARAQAPRILRPRLTAQAKRVLAVLIAAGSVLTGIGIPPQTAGFLTSRRHKGMPARIPGAYDEGPQGLLLR